MIRLFALVALFAALSNAATIPVRPQQPGSMPPSQRTTLDEALAQLLENIREILRTGDPERGIPVMAPLQTDQLNVDLSLGGLLDFSAILRNLFVDGLDRFQGTLTLNVMLMEFRYDLLFPDVVAHGQYDADGRLFGLIPVFGFGNFHVAPRDLRIQGTAQLRQLPSGYLHMNELRANVRLGSLQNNIDGMLLGGELSDLLNEVIQDLVPSVLVNFASEVTDIISRVGIPIADSILNTMTMDDLFALIPLKESNQG
uniref:Hemolymph juvenile hormone binding protein n=1 Tax=Anopheles dirus TaxID=7168 RepID=A0A1Y9H2A1_9DIPT